MPRGRAVAAPEVSLSSSQNLFMRRRAMPLSQSSGELLLPISGNPWRFEMNPAVTEEQVRALAYRLWEDAGSPEGRSEEFWAQAVEQLGGEAEGVEKDDNTASNSNTETATKADKP